MQTFPYDGVPGGVSPETVTFEDIGGGRSRAVCVSLFSTRIDRDAMLAGGMEHGVVEGYEKLDGLLAHG